MKRMLPSKCHEGARSKIVRTGDSSFVFVRVPSWAICLALSLAMVSCDKAPSAPPTTGALPTIASMVPAATDLLVGMGAKDQLVAVSTYDRDRADVGMLPKAGDYQTVDWEQLRALHPTVLISQIAPDRQNAGFKANLAELNITSLNVTIENLNDIFTAIDALGTAIKRPELAIAAKQNMHTRLDAVQKQSALQKPVRALLVISSTADAVVGPGNYLDDLLKIAGGENCASGLSQHWPQIDREMLLSLKPDVIIQLLPGASAQVRLQAQQTWKQLPTIPAVANGRVYPIYENYALLPGWHVTDLAEQFSRCLHPATTQP